MVPYLQRLESFSPTAITCLLCDIKRQAAAAPETSSTDIKRQVEYFYSKCKHIKFTASKSTPNVGSCQGLDKRYGVSSFTKGGKCHCVCVLEWDVWEVW